jgi:hypothetical protein
VSLNYYVFRFAETKESLFFPLEVARLNEEEIHECLLFLRMRMIQEKNVMKMQQMCLLALKYQVLGVKKGHGICEQLEIIDISEEGTEPDHQSCDM